MLETDHPGFVIHGAWIGRSSASVSVIRKAEMLAMERTAVVTGGACPRQFSVIRWT